MYFTPAEADFKEMVQQKIAGNHFLHYLGFVITDIGAGVVEGELDLKAHHLQQMNFVHGGVTATIADLVAGFAAFTLVRHGQGVVTIELKVSYLNPGKGDKVFAKGFVLKAGQRMHFCESEIWCGNEENKVLIAKATTTMAVINPEDIRR